MTKRRRSRSALVTCWISGSVAAIAVVTVAGLAGLSVRGTTLAIRGVDFVQQLLDAVLSRDGIIVLELQLGDAFQPQARANLPAEERGGAIERARAVLARRFVAKHGVENPGELDVRAHVHARERDEPD